MRSHSWGALSGLVLALGLSLGAMSCSKKQDVVVEAADRVSIDPAEIDRDPLALLPGGAIGLARIDAPAFFHSSFGQRLKAIADARIPLPKSAGFVPERDLSTLYVGVYSMQGVDSVVVAKGVFHPDAIEHAADGTTMTPLGAPLVKTTYAKRTLYVSRNVGFVVLTEHTVLLGDETGIRRALDRLSEGRAEHSTPKWAENVLSTPNAAVAAAVDMTKQAPAEAVSKNLAFLSGMKTARIVGNFESPGMNFAGTLTYPDAQAAQSACTAIQQVHRTISSYSFFMSLAGISNPIQRLEVQPSENDAKFVVVVEGRSIEWALNQVADRFGVAPVSAAR